MSTMLSMMQLQNYPVRSNHRGNLVWCMDMPLLTATLALLCISWVMVSSASLDYAFQTTGDTFYFCKRHGIYVLISLFVGALVMNIPYSRWRRIDVAFLVIAVFLLIIVLLPHVGRRINGSQRWLNLGFMTLQVSEIAKCASVIFFAGYLVRRREEMLNSLWGFIKPFLVLGLIAVCLLYTLTLPTSDLV